MSGRSLWQAVRVQINADLNEIVDIARGMGMLPDAVTDLAGTPGQVTAKVHADQLPGMSGAKKAAAKMAGAIGVTVTTEMSDSTFTVVIAASARGFNVSEMVAGEIQKIIAKAPPEAPTSLVSVRTGEGRTMVDVDVEAAVKQFKVRLTSIEIGDTITVTTARA